METDVIGVKDFLNTWLPEQFNKQIPPIIDKAEQTISNVQDKIRNTLRDNVINSRMSVTRAQTTVMDHLADRLGAVESRIDTSHRKVLNNIDLSLIPHETYIPPIVGTVPTCPPCTIQVADPIYPSTGICVPDPTCPPIGGPGSSGGIDNVPICPPCPPPPICPPPEPCTVLNLFIRPCKEWDKNCIYFLPAGVFPLGPQDEVLETNIPCRDDTIKIAVAQGLQHCLDLPYGKLECANVPVVPPKPFGGLPPGCCPQIVNIQVPPGGVINNNPIPTNPIINIPSGPGPIVIPPYPEPIPPGFGLNIQVVCAMPGTKPGKCPPAGDMAYYSLECNDDSKIKLLWNEIMGHDLNAVFGDKNLRDWWNDKTKDWKTATTNFEEVITEPSVSAGVE